MWPFSDFQFYFNSSRSTADLLTVVPDRIARDFNRSGATQAVALDIFTAFSTLIFFTNYVLRISGQIFSLMSSFLSNRRL